ncbi:MAG: chromate transporter [Lawsonibacter sp.]|nr:chromate transporter [Lawsonibacter sp.]
MIFLRLFFEFAKVGLFAVGGGLATIPFLQDMGARTGWFTDVDLTTMIAVSESTPGPMGVNMATYVGFQTGSLTGGLPGGAAGAVIATLGLITPSIIVIMVIAGFLQKFRQSRTVDAVFYGLRPASTALIASAGLSVALSVLVTLGGSAEHTLVIHWPKVALAAAVFLCMQHKKLKKLHPIIFIAAAAALGVIFQF